MNFPRPLSSPIELRTPPSPPSASHPSLKTTFSPSLRHPLPSCMSQTPTPFLSKGREGQSSDQGVSPATACLAPCKMFFCPLLACTYYRALAASRKPLRSLSNPLWEARGWSTRLGFSTPQPSLAQLLTDLGHLCLSSSQLQKCHQLCKAHRDQLTTSTFPGQHCLKIFRI